MNRIRAILARVFYARLNVLGREKIPPGPTLIISNHRNGAVDGFLLAYALRGRPVRFITSRHFKHSIYLNLLMGGEFDIYRKVENIAQAVYNRRQFQRAAEFVTKGGTLVLFPEGTSKLGPGLLPLKAGALELLEKLLPPEIPFTPVGLEYEAGWRFRSVAEIRFGDPVTRKNPLPLQVRNALLELTINCPDAPDQRASEAYAAALRNYNPAYSQYRARAQWTQGLLPEAVRNVFRQGSQHPAIPDRPWCYAALLAAPLVLLAALWNLPTLLGAWFLSRKADDNNVIALFKLLTGLPLWLIQTTIQALTLVVIGQALLWPLGLLLSLGGLLAWPALRRAMAAVQGLFYSKKERDLIKSICEEYHDSEIQQNTAA